MRVAVPASPQAAPGDREPASVASPAFDRAAAVLTAFFVVGLYLDGWAHVHGHVDQSFFTPWHAALYGAFLTLAAFVGAAAVRGRRRGLPLGKSVPPGYELSLLGAGTFLVAGAGDMIWHLVFGIELNVDALYSPTHLALAVGAVLLGTGPLRSAWRRSDAGAGGGGRGGEMPWFAVLSLTCVLSVLTFFTQIAHPLVGLHAAGARPDLMLFAFSMQTAIALQAAVLMGFVLLAVRRFTLPPGAFSAILGLNALAVAFLSREVFGRAGSLRLVPAALVAGLLSDVLYARLRSSPLGGRPLGLRLLAFGVPVIFYLLYFLTLIATTGIWWSIHLWLGSVVIAGIAGWLLSYVAAPPAPGAARGDVELPAWR